jgi:acetaldehyde dehydrogenase (acetylating)
MGNFDQDLVSIQEARELAVQAFNAWKIWAKASQEQVARVCSAMAEAAFNAADRLGRVAHEETGYGVADHKRLKNEFAARSVWESIKDIKTVGVIGRDDQKRIYEIAWPMGVIAALTPSTNPTSTVIYKTLISVKARDAIVIAPHPSAVQCCNEAVAVLARAAEENGAPRGLISCMRHVSLQEHRN